MYYKYFDTALKAACAVDLFRLVLGRPAVNLPAEIYKAEWVAAAAEWMQQHHARVLNLAAVAQQAASQAAVQKAPVVAR